MGWREEMVAQHKKTIAELQDSIDQMSAGSFEMRSLKDGKWVVVNDECIMRDEATIKALTDIIGRAEAEIADANRT